MSTKALRRAFRIKLSLIRPASKLKDCFDALAPDDIKQHQRRAAGAFCASFKLRHVANRQIEEMRKHGLTEIDLLAKRFYSRSRELDRNGRRQSSPRWRIVILSRAAFGKRPLACISRAVSSDSRVNRLSPFLGLAFLAFVTMVDLD